MTKTEIRDSVKSRLGSEWISINQILDSVINDIIDDEYQGLVADTEVLEEESTINGDDTNNYIKLDDEIMFISRVRYGYTVSDAGDVIEQVSPLELSGELVAGDPSYCWFEGIGKYDSQYIYFDRILDSSINIRILYSKWAETTANPLEIKELWGKALKHIITAHVALMGRNIEQVQMRKPLHDFEIQQYSKTMKDIKSIPKFSNITTVFTDA